MTLGLRKIILLCLIGGIFLMANVVVVANWLTDSGVSQLAQTVKNNYLTGTAVTIILALLILLVGPKKTGSSNIISFVRRCPGFIRDVYRFWRFKKKRDAKHCVETQQKELNARSWQTSPIFYGQFQDIVRKQR